MGVANPTRAPAAPQPGPLTAPTPVQTTPTTQTTQAANPVAEEASRIEQVLAQPEIQAALLQFGVNMLQPLGFADSFGGRLGRSLGAAGEAVGRVQQTRRDEQSEAAAQDIAGRRATSDERRAGAQEAQVGVAQDRNAVLREQLQAQVAENRAAGERAARQFGLTERGQNIDVLTAMEANRARQAQALIEQSALAPTPEDAAAMLQRAQELTTPLPFDMILGQVEGGRTQSTADSMMTLAAQSGDEAKMSGVLQQYGWEKEQIARAQQVAQDAQARAGYAPIPELIQGPTGGGPRPEAPAAPPTPAPTAQRTPAGEAARTAVQSSQQSATAAVEKMRQITPQTVTPEQFSEIQNDPFQRQAARRIWGDAAYDEVSRRMSGAPAAPRGGGRGLLGTQ